jgi:hypothetical protein
MTDTNEGRAVPDQVANLITAESMFEPLLLADPSFTSTWREFVEEYGEEPPLPRYQALADLARHLIGKVEANDTARFGAVFDVVERWFLEGDDYVREAATVGLLEDIQNTNLHRTTTPDDFLPWLRPLSRRQWDRVDAFWRDGVLISDVD